MGKNPRGIIALNVVSGGPYLKTAWDIDREITAKSNRGAR
jgi:hypothetical protein